MIDSGPTRSRRPLAKAVDLFVEKMTQKAPSEDKAALLSQDIRAVCGDRYHIDSVLGAGAFGEVYKALDTLLNRTVALKRIREDFFSSDGSSDELRLRFLREAQVAAQLQHPNIVTIYDIISSPELNLIVMEFVDGITLADRLKSEHALGLSETIKVLSQVTDALDHAHSQRVVHRDIKPANILISHKGLVKVTDFGTAKADSSAELTVVGSITGTPDYMSPEQARGDEADGRSDLFSLGCVVFQCLAGEKPFRSSNVTGVLLRIVSDDPSPVDSEKLLQDPNVDALLKKALAKSPDERFQNAAEFGRALGELRTAEEETPPQQEAPAVSPEEQATTPNDTQESDSQSRDSVADVLMKEARESEEVETFLFAMRRENRQLSTNTTSMLEFRNVSLTPEEAFILSRVDGGVTPSDILSVSPLSETDSARALLGFLRTGLICFGEPSESECGQEERAEEHSTNEEPEKPQATGCEESKDSIRSEVEELFERSLDQDDHEVLGVAPSADVQEIKSAFQKLAFRLHPDRHSSIKDEDFHKKLSQLFTRVNDAFGALAERARSGGTKPEEATKPIIENQTVSNVSRLPDHATPHYHDPQQARDLYLQAKAAYQKEDYWRAIEYCQKAVEIDQSRADYFHLLGVALSQNPKWKHDAEKNLRMATEMDPSQPEYFAALGTLYQSEGLGARARRAFEKLKALDPNYPIPDGG